MTQRAIGHERYAFGPFKLEVSSRKFSRGDEEIQLPSRAHDALVHLLRNRDRIVEKDELISVVWAGAFVSDDSLVHCVSVLRRALQDDSERPKFIATLPRRGYQFVGELEVEVETSTPPVPVESHPEPPPALPDAPARSRAPQLIRWAAVVGVLGITAWIARGALTAAPPTDFIQDPVILGQLPPPGTRLASLGVLSPDAKSLAFSAVEHATGKTQIWVRTLESQTLRPLEGTQGASRPFWSPDGRRLAYFSGDKLKVATLSGDPVRTIAALSVSPSGGSWSGNQLIFGDTGTGLSVIDTESGALKRLTTLDPATDVAHAWPSFLPDGRHFLFAITSWSKDRTGLWLGSLDSAEPPRRLLPVASPAIYTEPGQLLYIENDTLVAAPFDPTRGSVEGTATPIAANVILPRVAEGEAFSVAGSFLSFRTGARADQLAWFTRQGQRIGTVEGPTPLRNPMMSPDGTLLLATGTPSRNPGLWLVDLKANVSTRLGPDGIGPLWSPDGRHIAFTAPGGLDIFTSSTSGRVDNRLLLHDDNRKVLQAWSPDGRFMVFTKRTLETQLDLWLLPVNAPDQGTALLATPANERGAAISPDGRWLAYTSDESGQSEVYLQEFPGLGSKRVVSSSGGGGAYWRGDGNELFYVAPDRSLMSVEVKLGVTPNIGRPRALFRAPLAGELSEARNHYVASRDGKTFLVNVTEDSDDRGAFAVMLNWKARLATPKRDALGARWLSRTSRALGIS